jgi:hypothetical protein
VRSETLAEETQAHPTTLYALLAERAGDGARGETTLTASKETLDADGEEREQWLLTLGN